MCDVSLGKTIWFSSFKLGRFTETFKVVHPGGGHGTHSSILAWRIQWSEEPGGGYSL